MSDPWKSLKPEARALLTQRNYTANSLAERLATSGVEAGELVAAGRGKLADERAGLPRRVMRFVVEGDDRRGANNAGVVIPAGVAHALRVEGSVDAIMVYGTSTQFDPAFEGRIADGVEKAPLPPEWENYLSSAK